MDVRSQRARLQGGGGIVNGARIVADQESATRLTVRIEAELWDGTADVGRIEVDLAKHLDPRISITVRRLDERSTGPIEIIMV